MSKRSAKRAWQELLADGLFRLKFFRINGLDQAADVAESEQAQMIWVKAISRQDWPHQLRHRCIEPGRFINERLVSRLLEPDEFFDGAVNASK